MRAMITPMWSSRSIYAGRRLLATVRRVKKVFEVRAAKRKVIGRFPTIKKAMAAIDESCAEPEDNG